jgi:hypothetical protein
MANFDGAKPKGGWLGWGGEGWMAHKKLLKYQLEKVPYMKQHSPLPIVVKGST